MYCNTTNQTATIEFSDVQKNELSIYRDFYEVDDLKYDNGHLNTKIYLNDKVELYNRTQLFTQRYNVTISLKNNQTDEVYISFDKLN